MPRRFRNKAQIELAIGSEELAPVISRMPPLRRPQDASFRVLYAGRYVDYKGMHLGLPAFARLVEADPEARLTMVGEGPAKRRWQKPSLISSQMQPRRVRIARSRELLSRQNRFVKVDSKPRSL